MLGIKGVYHAPRVERLLHQEGGPTKNAPGRCAPFAKGVHAYSSDPRGYFGPTKSIEYLHNSEGWRDEEHEIKKPSGTFRILGLGDSYLWGEGVKRADICLTKLGPLLSDAAEGLTIETINTGYPGLDTITERNVFYFYGRRYDPDLVILFFVPNDVVTEWHPGPKVEFFREYHTIYEAQTGRRAIRMCGAGPGSDFFERLQRNPIFVSALIPSNRKTKTGNCAVRR